MWYLSSHYLLTYWLGCENSGFLANSIVFFCLIIPANRAFSLPPTEFDAILVYYWINQVEGGINYKGSSNSRSLAIRKQRIVYSYVCGHGLSLHITAVSYSSRSMSRIASPTKKTLGLAVLRHQLKAYSQSDFHRSFHPEYMGESFRWLPTITI